MEPAPIINITGEKVALGPHRRELIPLFQRWLNDFEVTRSLCVGLRPMTQEAEEAWYQGVAARNDDVLFTIYELPTMRPIGTAGLHHVNHFHGTAEFGLLIGEKECWGKGYGTEVATLMLDYGFHGLGLHNIWLSVFSFNERAIRAYTRAGYQVIGRRRQAIRLGSELHDLVYMDCLASEFESPVMKRYLAPLPRIEGTAPADAP